MADSRQGISRPSRQQDNVQLLASGLNAHGQLDTTRSTQDIYTFRPIVQDAHVERVLFASWSSTVVFTSTGITGLGHQRFTQELEPTIVAKLKLAFGDEDGMIGCLDNEGKLYLVESLTAAQRGNLICRTTEHSPSLGHIAVAGNGKVAISFKQAPNGYLCHLLTFESLDQFLEWYEDPSGVQLDAAKQHFMIQGRPKQLLANTATFLVLMEGGDVYSWGDPRYQSLGRPITGEDAVPAQQPGIVEALGGLTIAKIANGGWLSAALSEDGALYLWGARTPGTDGTIKCIREAQAGEIVLVDIPGQGGNPIDIVDIGVGDNHVALITKDRRLFVAGDNKNGQLGIDQPDFVHEWTLVHNLGTVQSITCGPKSTLIMANT